MGTALAFVTASFTEEAAEARGGFPGIQGLLLPEALCQAGWALTGHVVPCAMPMGWAGRGGAMVPRLGFRSALYCLTLGLMSGLHDANLWRLGSRPGSEGKV